MADPVGDPVGELIDTLARARLRQELTRDALSLGLGITPMSVSHWEHRRDDPGASNLLLWARLLGFTVVVLDEASGRVLAVQAVPGRHESPQAYRLRCVALTLREARRRLELTQEDLGERLGVSVWTVQMWEATRRVPRVSRLCEWCAAVGCRIELRSG